MDEALNKVRQIIKEWNAEADVADADRADLPQSPGMADQHSYLIRVAASHRTFAKKLAKRFEIEAEAK